MLFWKMAILKMAGAAFMAVLLSIAGTLNGVEWNSFNSSEKFVAITLALGQMWTVISAFLNETMSDLKKKKELETQFVPKPP